MSCNKTTNINAKKTAV